MAIPRITVLDDREVESIHESSLDILEQVGIYLPIREVLHMLRDKGADVDYQKNIAKIPANVVEENLREAPSEFDLYARDPKFDMKLKPGNTYFGFGGGSTRFVNMETNLPQEASLVDLAKLATIADALDSFSLVHEIVVPVDVPPEVSAQYIWASLFENTRKHIMMYLSDADYVTDGIRMASAVAGGREKLSKKPIASFCACIGQPLTYEEKFLRGFVEAAKQKIPMMIFSGAMSGATAPVTLAGTLALSNAEVLSGIVIAQIVSPGHLLIFKLVQNLRYESWECLLCFP